MVDRQCRAGKESEVRPMPGVQGAAPLDRQLSLGSTILQQHLVGLKDQKRQCEGGYNGMELKGHLDL